MENNRRREYARRQKKQSRGCLGVGVTIVIAAVALFLVLLFATDVFNGPKQSLLRVFYPQKYSSEVEASSKEFNVDKNLVYAVIHTESRFQPDAESHAGAVGLMQLMPETFTWLQERLDGEVIYSDDSLYDPAVNIRYGTYFLSTLLKDYSDPSAAIAAYNAGSANVDSWLNDPSYSGDGKTLTVIPYEETRNYVEKVNNAWETYRRLYG